ncbi:hypothetical protein TEQG_04193 [Trichophyton equinum CBS 127.97]|uniref:Uncharacterized protein n=1 Tax=Trichophyton equinum (strain ATCC MYA-4606 / CBS 127.97) TaxID=559882 RepID=F2PTF7_TRIEC|nr:hypothetical protein TEQG_04193 [Trichophyton equinum CBS 127.97]
MGNDVGCQERNGGINPQHGYWIARQHVLASGSSVSLTEYVIPGSNAERLPDREDDAALREHVCRERGWAWEQGGDSYKGTKQDCQSSYNRFSAKKALVASCPRGA